MAQKRCYSSPTDLQKSGLKESDVSLAGGGGGGVVGGVRSFILNSLS